MEEQIRELQQRRSENKRKLDAAEVFADALSIGPVAPTLPSPSENLDSEEPSDSIPTLLVANMRETGAVLNIKQIKQRLIDLGFGDKVKTQPNYHYQTAYRLTKRGKLLRRGTKYRAAPHGSSQEETGAVGAPVH